MSRTLALLATTAVWLAGAPALAQEAPAEPAAAAAQRQPASAETRAAYDRMDPLARSVFWAGEFELNPNDPVAGVKLAQALREVNNLEGAVSAAERVLVVQPDSLDALLELGRSQALRGQAFYGIPALERARDLAPTDWRPWSLLGVAYQQVRRSDDARAAWNEGLRLSPDNPAILANAGMALLSAGDAAGAEALLRRAATQPGASLRVRLNLALALGLQGKAAEAEQILRRDLPPELADQNLAWLRERTAPGQQASAETARTWSSLQ
jgi:Flp pilus assembly protein TadD